MNEPSTNNTVSEKTARLVSEFAADADWEARYRRIIEKGKQLPPLPEQYRTEQFKVKGCQSQVWLHVELDAQKRMRFFADSDAMIVRGLVACLVEVYSGSTPNEVLATRPTFISEIGFESNLSPSRANGLHAMIKQIYLYATAFLALAKR